MKILFFSLVILLLVLSDKFIRKKRYLQISKMMIIVFGDIFFQIYFPNTTILNHVFFVTLMILFSLKNQWQKKDLGTLFILLLSLNTNNLFFQILLLQTMYLIYQNFTKLNGLCFLFLTTIFGFYKELLIYNEINYIILLIFLYLVISRIIHRYSVLEQRQILMTLLPIALLANEHVLYSYFDINAFCFVGTLLLLLISIRVGTKNHYFVFYFLLTNIILATEENFLLVMFIPLVLNLSMNEKLFQNVTWIRKNFLQIQFIFMISTLLILYHWNEEVVWLTLSLIFILVGLISYWGQKTFKENLCE